MPENEKDKTVSSLAELFPLKIVPYLREACLTLDISTKRQNLDIQEWRD